MSFITMKISEFISWLKTNKQSSLSTIDNYSRTLRKLDEYLKELTFDRRGVEDTENLTVLDVEWFIRGEKLRWLSARTCNSHIVIIRAFLNYAKHCWEKVLDFKNVTLMKSPKKKIDALSENDKNKLLLYMQSDTSKDELTKTRDYAIVSVLLYTWLRVSELCNIKLDDVKKELQVIWKNSTIRLVYLFQDHVNILRLYLFLREGKGIKSDYLFCSHSSNSKWKKLSRNTVESIVREAWEKAWLSEPVWPHKLRHTFATDLLRRWWNIYYIKQLLWHASVLTTQNYLTVTNKDLKETQELLLNRYDDQTQQLDPMPKQFVYTPEEVNAINSNKYFDEYSKNNFNSGLIPNAQRGVWYYWYAF